MGEMPALSVIHTAHIGDGATLLSHESEVRAGRAELRQGSGESVYIGPSNLKAAPLFSCTRQTEATNFGRLCSNLIIAVEAR